MKLHVILKEIADGSHRSNDVITIVIIIVFVIIIKFIAILIITIDVTLSFFLLRMILDVPGQLA